MSPPAPQVGSLQRVVALLTAIEGDNSPAVNDILAEFTRDDALRMGTMYVESIRQQAAERGLPMAVALQVFGQVAARHAQGGPS